MRAAQGIPEIIRGYLVSQATYDSDTISRVEKWLVPIAKEATPIIEVFQDDRDRIKYAMIVLCLGLRGSATRKELETKLDIEKSSVNRHLNVLQARFYVRLDPPKEGRKYLYSLLEDGVRLCSFLGLDDETLWMRYQEAEKFGVIENLSLLVPLSQFKIPSNFGIRCQLDYLHDHLPKLYLKSRWGKEYLSILERDPDALRSVEFQGSDDEDEEDSE